MSLTYLSLCSGVEAATLAWEPLGWVPMAFSEIEPFPCAVLAERWPDVLNLGDMLTANFAPYHGFTDVLIGGTPCQSFSVAGLRQGLADDRGNLTMRFAEIANVVEPRFILWENVPGVLSSRDNAFGCLLGALAGEDGPLVPAGKKWTNAGYVLGPERAIAWRVLDAQYFGVAQRRRRVFLVACPRDGADPRQILFESEGVRRDSPPSREAGENVAADAGCGVARTVALRGREGGGTAELGGDTATALRASSGGGGDKPHVLAFGQNRQSGPVDTSHAHGGPAGRLDFESETFLVQACHNRQEPCPSGEITHPLGAKDNGMAVAFTQNSRSEVRKIGGDGQIVGALAADVGAQQAYTTREVAPAITQNYGKQVDNSDTALGPNVAVQGLAVRRLMPVECERLQGEPDGHTAVTYRNKPAADGPRYKAIGNSMAVPCIRWIGERMELATLL